MKEILKGMAGKTLWKKTGEIHTNLGRGYSLLTEVGSTAACILNGDRYAATVSIKTSAVLWDWRCNKGKLLRSAAKYFLAALWFRTTPYQ
jgi:hypothetical protein